MNVHLSGGVASVSLDDGVLKVRTDQVGGPPSGATEIIVDTNVTKQAVINLIYGLTQVVEQMP